MAIQASGLSYAVRLPVLGRYFGQFCFVIGALTLLPLGVSLFFGETHIRLRYLLVTGILGGLGAVLSRIPASGEVQDNEAMVLAAWLFLFAPAVMAFPMKKPFQHERQDCFAFHGQSPISGQIWAGIEMF